MATWNKIRPSCARVKVEVDLLGEFPKRINIGVRNKTTGEIKEKWIQINYDYIPKYCKTCKLQGHNEKECYVLHPELYPKEEEQKEENDKSIKDKKTDMGTQKEIEEKGEHKKNEFQEQRNRGGGGRGTRQVNSEMKSLDLNKDTEDTQEGESREMIQFNDDKIEEEEDDLTQSVKEVSATGDLSPRHVKALGNTARKRKNTRAKTSQINTRSSSARQGSDHAPLHMMCENVQEEIVKPFRFLNFWKTHKKFNEVVQQQWDATVIGSPFSVVQQKMKNLKWALTINIWKYYQIEEEYWKQKAGMQWFQEGDRNTKFFHSHVKGKKRKLMISEIQTDQGDTIHTTKNIGEEAVKVFKEHYVYLHENVPIAIAWDSLCLPKDEGGLGFRSLHDVSDALFAKLWWIFRTSTNLACVEKMIKIREDVEHNIWWHIKSGDASF
ncbi:hypothetical protein R3W88_034132 [Solanum pinnatisectum]|uniref:DUF4283 domain-containing protein n=1 Tax=Solanum pinnatisectum TaxID=50273 RepID=A0AAV9K0U0_9SOLN|nr:hypothetical protein R3W88_034132 [Solanum pinnatisectum]